MATSIGTRRCARCGTVIAEGMVCRHCQRRAHQLGSTSSTTEVLALDSLEVPTAYQREERQHLVRRIIREFDPDLLGHLTVVRDPDGRQWLLDGQHRWLALVELGFETATCEVLHQASLPRQAKIFSGRNGLRVPPGPRDAFKSDYTANDPDVLAIVAILERHGYRVPFEKTLKGS